MPIRLATSRQVLADAYKGMGNWFAACTGDPGNTTTVANETSGTGGSGAYARLQGTWASGSGGILTCTNVVLSVPAGTFTYGALCSAVSGATQLDNALIANTVFNNPGQLVFTPGFTVT